MALSRRAHAAHVRDADPNEADVSELGAQEHVGRVRREDGVTDLSGDHRELRHPEDDVAIGDLFVEVVEESAKERHDRRLDAVGSNAIGDVGAAADRGVEFLEQLRWIFAVHVDHRVAVGRHQRQPREERRVVAEVPGEADDLDAFVTRPDLLPSSLPSLTKTICQDTAGSDSRTARVRA